jgi:MFS family permease
VNRDALAGWGLSAFLALCIVACLTAGQIPTRYQTIRRSETPRLFWTCVVIAGAFLFVFVFIALYFTLPTLPSR